MLNTILVVITIIIIGCNAQNDHPEWEIGQRQHSPDIPFNARTEYTFPKDMFEFLERYNWGDFHMVFHMSRKYYVMGQQGRNWLDRNSEKPAPYQEGDPNNGIEFLAMHRAMLEYLKERFGSTPITNDPEGFPTVGRALEGWKTDEECARGLERFGGDSDTFRRGLVNINNFAQFKSEDEFGNFMQTSMRLVGQVDPANPARRQYTYDRRPGSGVHNWLHGQLMDDSSPITVGDPRTNLPNILFWRIHGWIEAKWKQFEASRKRSDVEQSLYDGFMSQFRAHMIRMSEKGAGGVGAGESTTAAPEKTTRARRTRKPRSTRGRRTRAPALDTGRNLLQYRQDRPGRRPSSERQLRVDQYVGGIMGKEERSLKRTHMAARRRVPWSLVYHLRHRMFRNHVPECRTLTEGTIVDNCPFGPDETPNSNARFGRDAPRDDAPAPGTRNRGYRGPRPRVQPYVRQWPQ